MPGKKMKNSKDLDNAKQKLVLATDELAFQNEEKEKRAAELLIANKELAFQNEEKEKRAEELLIANKELAFQNVEKEKRALELTIANAELQKTEKRLKENIEGLKVMMFMTSHRVRQPVANLIALANLLDSGDNSPEEFKRLLTYIKQSANTLDVFTKELTDLMSELEKRQNK